MKIKKYAEPAVAICYLTESLSALKESNIDVDIEAICNKLGISQKQINDPTAYMTLSQLRNGLSLMREKFPIISGLPIGRRMGPTSHGFAGLTAVTQQNVGECFQTIEKVFELRLPVFSVKYIQEKEYFGLRFTEVLPLEDDLPFLLEVILASFYNIGKIQSKETHNIHKISFSFPEPENAKLYYDYFGDNIEFDSIHSEYLVPIDRYYDAITMRDSTTTKYFAKRLEDETPTANKETLAKIILSILEEEQECLPGITTMASKLAMSDRTLRRKLNSLDTTYQDLLNLYKKNKATSYLRKTEKTITEISILLDYQDPSHFSKVFKEWTGFSPTHYRKEHCSAPMNS